MTTSTSADIEAAPLGATRVPGGDWQFLLWAPRAHRVDLQILGAARQSVEMERHNRGYHFAVIEALEPGQQYLYRLDRACEIPDPASRFQPEGVHGASQLVDPDSFQWADQDWTGVPLERSIFYEVHVGTYTPEGSFDALAHHLPELAALGITTIELMPVAQFPGARNWGYDGVFPFAPQNTYGGPAALQRLVDAAHAHGLAVALDVVYNHLGPEGNYLGTCGPYFTDRYRTPWGEAINFDGASSDEVRRFFIENALYWLENYHFDALRLDAIHGIFDFGALHFLAELKSSVAALARRLGRQIYLIAESDLNDARVLRSRERGGNDLDAQWSDDFHHSLHTLLTGERNGYYQDFGSSWHLATTLRDGWCYSGQYSQHRQRKHGNSPRGISPSHFVVCNQNHDQVGNRAMGERLSTLVDFEALKLAAGVTLLSPFVPLLFMGEVYADPAPFLYFTSHIGAELAEAVHRGRQEEFAAFGWEGHIPDPQSETTFRRSKLRHGLKAQEPHATLLRFYHELIRFRNEYELGSDTSRQVRECGDSVLLLVRNHEKNQLALILNFARSPVTEDLPELQGMWHKRISSADPAWRGPGDALENDLKLSPASALRLSPQSFVVLESPAPTSEST